MEKGDCEILINKENHDFSLTGNNINMESQIGAEAGIKVFSHRKHLWLEIQTFRFIEC
jgi:hypothetical protein